MEFIPPSGDGDEDDGTTPLEDEAETPDDEGLVDEGEPDMCTSRCFFFVPLGPLASYWCMYFSLLPIKMFVFNNGVSYVIHLSSAYLFLRFGLHFFHRP